MVAQAVSGALRGSNREMGGRHVWRRAFRSTGSRKGRIPLPDGSSIEWARQRESPERGQQFQAECERVTYAVWTTQTEPDGSVIVTRYEVPGRALHAFFFELDDPPGEIEQVVMVTSTLTAWT